MSSYATYHMPLVSGLCRLHDDSERTASKFQACSDAESEPPAVFSTCNVSYLDSWHRLLTDWVIFWMQTSRRSDDSSQHGRPAPHRVDSGISLDQAYYLEDFHGYLRMRQELPFDDPLRCTFHFEDHAYTKTLDYQTFSQWNNINALLTDLEQDGVIVEQLWDVMETMQICSGDWDARARPGWEVDVFCVEADLQERGLVYENESDSDEDSLEEGSSIVEWSDAKGGEKEWWFTKWRARVEQGTLTSEEAERQPSWRLLLLCVTPMALVFCIFVPFADRDM